MYVTGFSSGNSGMIAMVIVQVVAFKFGASWHFSSVDESEFRNFFRYQ
jgi:hypothetical protein